MSTLDALNKTFIFFHEFSDSENAITPDFQTNKSLKRDLNIKDLELKNIKNFLY